ncbi:fructosamine-3-kinase [Pseudomonas sp. TE12234]
MAEQTKIGLNAVAYVQTSDSKAKRAYAVAAALELIAVRVLNNQSSDVLGDELAKLSTYADQIQEALKVKAN